jgi:phosphoserine phosphatase RsbU/P
MAEISVQAADGSRQRFAIQKDRVTIGRSRENDIFLPDQWLSRHHAEVRRRAEGFVLVDLGSKNGTLLNGSRMSGEARLRPGDVVTLGEHVLQLSETEPAPEREDDDGPDLYGTQIFSARELSDVATRPADAEGLARQNRILSILTKAASALIVHRPLPELFELILDLVFEAVPAERAAILLVEGLAQEPVIKASRSRSGETIHRVSRSIARRVLEQQVSLLIPNILEDAVLSAQDSVLSAGIRSALCAPLWFTSTTAGKQDRVIGLVYLDALARQAFSEEHLRLLTALANVAAAKIENARLLEESLEKQLLEEDIRTAAEIQRGLLPRTAPVVPGYQLTGLNQPCRTVGGDYYDFALDAGRLLLAIGDVSGKGTGAALLMTVLRAAVRGHWADGAPSEAMVRINRTVCQNVPSNKYVTFFMARLEPESGRLRYVNAGHNPPLLVRAAGEMEKLSEGGMVLGFFDTVPYCEGSATLSPGDALVLYSDGVTETFDALGDEFGEERLSDLVLRLRHLDAAGLEGAIMGEIESFGGGLKATDDRTLVVLKRV